MSIARKCKVNECMSNKVVARFMCNTHYRRFMKFGSPEITLVGKAKGCICKIHACENEVYAKNLCGVHYRRNLIHGDPNRKTVKDAREFKIINNEYLIPIGINGKDGYAKVDFNDVHRINAYKWSISTHGYAETTINRKTRKMHQLILPNSDKSKEIDHINRDKLDNRKYNLRIVTKSINMQNRTMTKKSLSIYQGVYKNGNRWAARISKNKKRYYLGNFLTQRDAAIAYNKGAIYHYGEHARLNVIID